MTHEVIHGDCLEVMRTMPDASVDAVVTDPPYMIGAVSVGTSNAKNGTWADMENSAYWFSAWMKQTFRILRPTGYLVQFTNWRSLPTIVRAHSLSGRPISSCMVWDKEWIGPAGPAQLRPRYEMVVFTGMEEARIDDRSQPDIISCKWMAGNMRETIHPAEKPVDLLCRIARLVTPPNGTVLDPFCGSGSTGKAAVLEGFNFIGIEREAEYVEIARARIEGAGKVGEKPARRAPAPSRREELAGLFEGVA